ncbi:MAG: putative hydrolase YxeP [Alphaproteobacteria bacterium MarineAlpha9_Bin4]|nr:amidohydrolase [Pelagibacterales bacterium]PPR27468.1 MAG: putative hydrolase YxeP [Alphaproteobacteria bacterium MarineAlpha9_Bin4]
MPIQNRIAKFHEEMKSWRHHFHKFPELAYKEINTSKKVVDLLKEFKVDTIKTGIGGTGVVATLENGIGKSIGLRADMDALPIPEENTKPYCSKNSGIMHACGHDGHTTMLLGAAKYLSETRNFKGKVVFIFQPAEEGFAGAKAMIEDGLFKKFPVDEIYGMHNMPNLESGVLAVQEGPRLAAADNFEVEIVGKGSHGAMPSNSIDPIVCGSAIVQNLQHIVSRNSNPKETLVITVASFISGKANNVIPKTAKLNGTIRYYNENIGKMAKKRFYEVINNTSTAFGAKSIITFKKGYPPTVNHKEQSEFAYNVAKKVNGNNSSNIQSPMMGSEDFSYFLKQVPGAFAWIGNGNSASLHNPKYDFDDNILCTGASFLATLAEDYLNT